VSARLAQFSERVAEFAREQDLFTGVQRLRIGFSGGADSTALVLLARRLHPEIEAVHLHHGLRGSAADADALWCRQFCARRDIPFTSEMLAVPRFRRAGESLEEAGRRLRLEYWAATTPASAAVALGHHLDDCLEDLLLRLARGANASGLTALRPRTEVCGVRIVRPLLCLRRVEIEQFLADQGTTDWRRDLSNDDTSLRRNAVRHQWLPLLRRTVGHDQGLLRSLEALREDADCLLELAHDHRAAVATPEALRRLHPALLPRVLRLWLRQETGRDWVLPRQAVLRLRRELDRRPAAPCRIPIGQGRHLELCPNSLRLVSAGPAVAARLWAWRRHGRLDLVEIGAALTAELMPGGDKASPQREPLTELFAAEALEETLHVRCWQPGDRMVPFGRRRPVKLQDLFGKAHLAREQRYRLPLVLCADTIIWVPGLRRAEFGRVQPGEAAVCLRFGAGQGPDVRQ
jgi:tRNA(Ile)-lysidine synthase